MPSQALRVPGIGNSHFQRCSTGATAIAAHRPTTGAYATGARMYAVRMPGRQVGRTWKVKTTAKSVPPMYGANHCKEPWASANVSTPASPRPMTPARPAVSSPAPVDAGLRPCGGPGAFTGPPALPQGSPGIATSIRRAPPRGPRAMPGAGPAGAGRGPS